MTYHGIVFAPNVIADFCRQHQIRRLAVFGSVLRDDFRPDSDVDVLIEFEQGTRVGLKFFQIQEELSQLLGRRVDLNTLGFLARAFREQVLAEAEVQYGPRDGRCDTAVGGSRAAGIP